MVPEHVLQKLTPWAPCRRRVTKGGGTEVIYPGCAGLDAHMETVVASTRVISEGAFQQQVRKFGTRRRELMEFSAVMSGAVVKADPQYRKATFSLTGSRSSAFAR